MNRSTKSKIKADLGFIFSSGNDSRIRQPSAPLPTKRSRLFRSEDVWSRVQREATSGGVVPSGDAVTPKVPETSLRTPFKSITNTDEHALKSASVTGFPSTFNPRKESNMPHKEKVDKWILTVPTYPSPVDKVWFNDCYTALDPLTDQIEEPEAVNSNFSDSNDIIQFQSKIITFLANKVYWCEPERPRDPSLEYLEIDPTNDLEQDELDGCADFLCEPTVFRIPLQDARRNLSRRDS